MEGKILFLCGKGGTGKDSVLNMLLKAYPTMFTRYVLTTTRDMRYGEIEGVEYHFCDTETFLDRDNKGEFIIVEKYSIANGNTNFYGVGDIPVDDTVYVLCGTNTQFYKLKEIYGDRVVGVYLYNTSYTSLTRMLSRLRDRTEYNVLESCRRVLSDSYDYMYIDFQSFDLTINTDDYCLSEEIELIHKLFE